MDSIGRNTLEQERKPRNLIDKGEEMAEKRKTKSETRAYLVYGEKKWQWRELEKVSLNCIKELSPSFDTAEEAHEWANRNIKTK